MANKILSSSTLRLFKEFARSISRGGGDLCAYFRAFIEPALPTLRWSKERVRDALPRLCLELRHMKHADDWEYLSQVVFLGVVRWVCAGLRVPYGSRRPVGGPHSV